MALFFSDGMLIIFFIKRLIKLRYWGRPQHFQTKKTIRLNPECLWNIRTELLKAIEIFMIKSNQKTLMSLPSCQMYPLYNYPIEMTKEIDIFGHSVQNYIFSNVLVIIRSKCQCVHTSKFCMANLV